MTDPMPMTAAGLRRLQDELKQLSGPERMKIAAEIEVARAHGDLRENAEYHAAKEKQGHIEGRINDINGWINRAEVIDVAKFKGATDVRFGATVELLDSETEKKVTYRLVGEVETDLKKRWISVASPVARGLIGKKVGDLVSVQSPGGVRDFEVLKVSYEDAE
jgi:transcription elongation factor GreA